MYSTFEDRDKVTASCCSIAFSERLKRLSIYQAISEVTFFVYNKKVNPPVRWYTMSFAASKKLKYTMKFVMLIT